MRESSVARARTRGPPRKSRPDTAPVSRSVRPFSGPRWHGGTRRTRRRDEGHLAAVPQRMARGGELPIDGQAKLLRYRLQRRVPGAGSGQRIAGGGAVTDLEDLRRGPRALPGGGEVEDRHAHGAPMVTRLTPEGAVSIVRSPHGCAAQPVRRRMPRAPQGRLAP